MGLFRKKDRVIDLTEHYKKQQEKLGGVKSGAKQIKSDSGSGNFFGGFFGGGNAENSSSADSQETGISETVNPEEKRRMLAKRLKEMTEKLEELSNQIYHLQQRIEVVEMKTGVGR